MNYYGSKELAESFKTVRNNTITIAEEIGEEHYGFRTAPETRTVGQMLVHVAVFSRLQVEVHGKQHLSTLEGFDFMTFMGGMLAEEAAPRTKAQIIDLLRSEGAQFSGWLAALSDDFLGERVTMPEGMTPPTKSRFEMILGVKEHEMHHRGQLMVIERMVGVVPHLTRAMMARFAAMSASAPAQK